MPKYMNSDAALAKVIVAFLNSRIDSIGAAVCRSQGPRVSASRVHASGASSVRAQRSGQLGVESSAGDRRHWPADP